MNEVSTMEAPVKTPGGLANPELAVKILDQVSENIKETYRALEDQLELFSNKEMR